MNSTVKRLKDYFIPHEGNDHRPHILRRKIIVLVCVVVIGSEAAFLFGTSFIAPRSSLFGIVVVNTLTDETNAQRVDNNLSDLQVSPLLQAAAQEKANDMVANNYFAHTSPTGVTPWHWFANVGYNFKYAGENLAINYSDSQDVTTAWMNSPEHRANILNTNYTQIGMATAQGTLNGNPAIYVVELFGTPAGAAAAPAPAETTPLAGTSPAVAATPALPATPGTETSAPVTIPASSPAAADAVAAPALVATTPATPVIIASETAASSENVGQTFIAVEGAQTTTAAIPATVAPIPQSNLFEQFLANSRQMANYFYLGLMLLFIMALMSNFFIKIRIQHPDLMWGGMTVVAVAAVCIIFNHQVIGLGQFVL